MWLIQSLTSWWPDNRISLAARGRLASPFIRSCGSGFLLGAHVTLLNADRLTIGNDVYVARGSWLNAMGDLQINDEVVIAPYVVISTLQHVFANGSVRFGGSIARPVAIGRGTWIAAHGTVKCGVSVGDGCIVAANSAVVRNTGDHEILAGVPARPVGLVKDGEAEFFSRSDRDPNDRENR